MDNLNCFMYCFTSQAILRILDNNKREQGTENLEFSGFFQLSQIHIKFKTPAPRQIGQQL